MTKVCFVSPEYWPLTGGTGSYVYYLSNELLKNGYSIHVVTGSNQTRDVHVNPQLDVSFLKSPKMPAVKSFLLAGNSNRKLKSIKTSADIDIMHPQLPLTPNFAVPPNYGKTLVCTVHSTWKGEAKAIAGEPFTRLNANEKVLVSLNPMLRFFEESMIHRARKVIAVSEFTKWELTNYYKIPAHKIKVIHNGVDIKKFQPAADKRRIKAELGFNPADIAIVSVGLLYARKGLFTLIESMPPVPGVQHPAGGVIPEQPQGSLMKRHRLLRPRIGDGVRLPDREPPVFCFIAAADLPVDAAHGPPEPDRILDGFRGEDMAGRPLHHLR